MFVRRSRYRLLPAFDQIFMSYFGEGEKNERTFLFWNTQWYLEDVNGVEEEKEEEEEEFF